MELVERERALQTLSSALASAGEREGRTVLITGEAGVGKSAVVSAFVSAHRKGADVLWGSCDALYTPRPLGPLRDIALHLQGDLLAALEANRDGHHLFTLFLLTLQQRERPAIVVFEDVHWADEATLDLIKFLGRRLANLMVLLILTYRDDEIDARHALHTLLGELPRAATLRITLQPLTEESVRTLVRNASRATDAARLHAATGGNPFYVTEVLAMEGAGVPATVRDAVLARAVRLSAAAREVLDVVSLAPGGMELWLIEACTQSADAAVDECASRGMLGLVRGNYVFRHELARLAVLDALAPLRRRELHRSVLRALRSRPVGPKMLARLAHHAEAAEDQAAVLEYAPMAAQEAASVGAHREAAAHLTSALRYADTLAPRDRALLFEQYAAQAHMIGELEHAISARWRASEIWRELNEPLRQAESIAGTASPYIGIGLDGRADETIRVAIALLERLPPGPSLAFAYSTYSLVRMLQRDHAAAMEWGAKALEFAERFNAREASIVACNTMGCSLILSGETERGCSYVERSIALAREGEWSRYVALAYTNLGWSFAELHCFERANGYLTAGIAYTKERDIGYMRVLMRSCQAVMHVHLGRWESAAETALAVLSSPGAVSIARMRALCALGRLRARRGDPGAMEALDEALHLAQPSGNLQRIAPIRAARAEAAWERGEARASVNEASAAYEFALAKAHPWFIGELAYWLWKGGALDEAPAIAAEPYRLQIEGQSVQAAAAWEVLGCPYEAARALAEAADADCLKRALKCFDELGTRPAADRVRQQLRELGLRSIPRGPRPSTRNNQFHLTARELEVIALLAQGLTNAEIAARLYRSAKTVDHHVSSVLSKLAVPTREAAVTAATAHGLLPK